jgi:hypothetical protein
MGLSATARSRQRGRVAWTIASKCECREGIPVAKWCAGEYLPGFQERNSISGGTQVGLVVVKEKKGRANVLVKREFEMKVHIKAGRDRTRAVIRADGDQFLLLPVSAQNPGGKGA